MEVFKEGLVVNQNSQEFVNADKKVKTIKFPLIAFPNEGLFIFFFFKIAKDEILKPSLEEKKNEIIIGLYKRENLEEGWTLGKEGYSSFCSYFLKI